MARRGIASRAATGFTSVILRMLAGAVGGLVLLVLPWAALAAALYLAVRPDVAGWHMRVVVAAVAGVLSLACAAWAAVQVKVALEGVTTTTETDPGGKGQVGRQQRQRVMLMRGYAARLVDAVLGFTLRVAGANAAPLTALLAVATVGVAPSPWAYLAAMVLGPLAAWTLARKAGAGRQVNFTVGEVQRICTLYGVPTLPVAVAAAGAAAVWGGLMVIGTPSVALLLMGMVTAAGTLLGRRAVAALRDETEDRARLLAPLALALGATEAEMDAMHWRIAPDGQVTITGRIPATILRHKNHFEDQFSEHMPTYEVEEVTDGGITVRPVTEDVLARRQMLAATRGFVLASEALTPEEMY